MMTAADRDRLTTMLAESSDADADVEFVGGAAAGVMLARWGLRKTLEFQRDATQALAESLRRAGYPVTP